MSHYQDDLYIMTFDEWQESKHKNMSHEPYPRDPFNPSPYHYPDQLDPQNNQYEKQFKNHQDYLKQKGLHQQVNHYNQPISYEQFEPRHNQNQYELPQKNQFHSDEYTYELPQKCYIKDMQIQTKEGMRKTGQSEYQDQYYQNFVKTKNIKEDQNFKNKDALYFQNYLQGNQINRDMHAHSRNQANQSPEFFIGNDKVDIKSSYQEFHNKKNLNYRNVQYPKPQSEINPQDKDSFFAKQRMEGYKPINDPQTKDKKRFQ